jgi:hypothetical protein
MAQIVHRVCPLARLYIAKLNDTGGRRKFTMKCAAKVISSFSSLSFSLII